MTVPPRAQRSINILLILSGLLAGCHNATTLPTATTTPTSTSTSTVSAAPPSVAPQPTPSATASAAGRFVAIISTVTAADVRYSWRAGCPVGPTQLRRIQLSYWGFDNRAHLGTIIVNAKVTSGVRQVFSVLYSKHFPIHRMQPVDAYHGSDPDSMAADNTSAFNCRYAVAPGPKSWSVHAYGEAIDVNTVENPYLEGGTVMPAAGKAYLNRGSYRPGMAVANGVLVKAFAAVGWKWGGRWTDSPDYQHFSTTGG